MNKNVTSACVCILEQIGKLEEEKIELITGVNQVTEEAQLDSKEVEEQLAEMIKCKNHLVSHVNELEDKLRGKDEQIGELSMMKKSRDTLKDQIPELKVILKEKEVQIKNDAQEMQQLRGECFCLSHNKMETENFFG